MKQPAFLLVASLMILSEVSCFHHRHHRKRSGNPMKRIPSSKSLLSGHNDRETLKEALQLLNVGKKTLGLNTEDPDLLLQLVENPNEKNKSESIEKLLEDPKQIPHAPIGKQYLALSGENGKVRVDNFTNVTPSPGEKAFVTSNDSDIQDVFKMIMEKEAPDSQSKVFHKITIIETNQLKPYSNKQLSHPSKPFKRRRRHKGWHSGKKLHIHPHNRQKRSRFTSKLNFFHRKPRANSNETPFFQRQIPKKINVTNRRYNEDPGIEISVSKLPGPIHVNKRFDDGNTFREPDDNFAEKELFRFGNNYLERKENGGRKRSNTVEKKFRFGDEVLEKLIDSIGFENSVKTAFPKATSKAVITESNRISTSTIGTLSLATTTKHPMVNANIQKRDLFPPVGVDRYALVERILPLERGSEPMSSRFLEVAAIVIITLLCFVIILLVHSKLYKISPTPLNPTETRKDSATSEKQFIRELNKNSLYNGVYYYKTVAMGEDDPGLLNLEWQSESGDWLSELEEKDKI